MSQHYKSIMDKADNEFENRSLQNNLANDSC